MSSTPANKEKEPKKVHTIYAYPSKIKGETEAKSLSILKIPHKNPTNQNFPLKLGKIPVQNMKLDSEKYGYIFDRMKKTDTLEGFETIPARFFEYTIQITETDIEFISLFESVCRLGFAEFYESHFKEDKYQLMFSRIYNYYGYEKIINEVPVEEYPISSIFGDDNADY